MKKPAFYVNILSRRSFPLGIVQELLSGPVMHQTVFPARGHYTDLTVDEWQTIDYTGSAEGFEHRFKTLPLKTVKDYDPAVLLEQSTPVSASTGLSFGESQTGSLNIWLSWGSLTQTRISLCFSNEQSQEGLITSSYGLALLREAIKVIRPLVARITASGSEATHTPIFKDASSGYSYDLKCDWLNYYGPELLTLVGKDRIERLRGHVSLFEYFEDGILISIVDETFNSRNFEHMQKLTRARELLDFAEIATEVCSNTV